MRTPAPTWPCSIRRDQALCYHVPDPTPIAVSTKSASAAMNVGESFRPDVISNCCDSKFRRFLARFVVDFAQRLHVIGNKGDRHNTNFARSAPPPGRGWCGATTVAATCWRQLCSDSRAGGGKAIRRAASPVRPSLQSAADKDRPSAMTDTGTLCALNTISGQPDSGNRASASSIFSTSASR